MRRSVWYSIFVLAVDIGLLALLFLHIPGLLHRAAFPCDLSETEGHVVVDGVNDQGAAAGLREKDVLLSWNGQPLRTEHEVEFLADFCRIGDRIPVRFERGGAAYDGVVTLIPYFSTSYVVTMYFIGVITWCLALFVRFRGPRDRSAAVLHWALIAMAIVVMASWEARVPGNPLAPLIGAVFLVSYAGIATTFVIFTTVFPRQSSVAFRVRLVAVFGPALVLIIPLLYYNVAASESRSMELLDRYMWWFDLFHIFLLIAIAGGILNFVRSYLISRSATERRKLKWVLFGLCIGPTPFLFLNVLPGLLNAPWVIPEQYTLAFLVFIPVSFAISFVKYHIMDVDLVINRATVYVIVLGVLTVVYVALVAATAALIHEESFALSTAAAVTVALLFQPVRGVVQRFVDRRFFRVHYDLRQAEQGFVDEIRGALHLRHLAETMVRRTDQLIPVERIGYFLLHEPRHRLVLLAHRNLSDFERGTASLDERSLQSPGQLPLSLPERVEPGVHYAPANRELFQRWKIVLAVPVVTQASATAAFLVLGEKKSGTRWSIEDVDLLRMVTVQAGLAVERITLQTRLVLEHAEAQRFEELSKLKSDFVSYVSHELRTPLTSIKMFTELLETRLRSARRKPKEYLEVVRGEADRLDRMVSTILDSARIDQGVKEYRMCPADLRTIAGEVLAAMKYQLDSQGFRLRFRPGRSRLSILADPEAVAQAIGNLVANAIKYSGERKHVGVTLSARKGFARCEVSDHGLGISAEAMPHLFEKFYRDPAHSDQVKGVGLGLPLVKHVMDAHNGAVTVHSVPGKGSSFTLSFPLSDTGDGTR